MTFMYYDADHAMKNSADEYCEPCGEAILEEQGGNAESEGDPDRDFLIGHTMLEGEEPFTCAQCGERVEP